MQQIAKTLSERNFRSFEKIVAVVQRNPAFLDVIITYLNNEDPLIRRYTADVIEKVSRKRPTYLYPYKGTLVEHTLHDESDIRVPLLRLLPRLSLDERERAFLFEAIQPFLLDTSDMVKIVSLQTVVALADDDVTLRPQIMLLLEEQIAVGISVNQSLARYHYSRLIFSNPTTDHHQSQYILPPTKWQQFFQVWIFTIQLMKVMQKYHYRIRQQELRRKQQALPTKKAMLKEFGNFFFYGTCTLIVCTALIYASFPLQFVPPFGTILLIVAILLNFFCVSMFLLSAAKLIKMSRHLLHTPRR